MSSKKIHFNESDCPRDRMGHVCQTFCDKYLLVWGGDMHAVQNTESFLWLFNTETEKWRKIECDHNPPNTSSACAILIDNHSLFLFGGFNSSVNDGRFWHSNHLYRLCLKKLIWEKCLSSLLQPSPRDKLAGWAHNQRIYFFGGFGHAYSTEPCYLSKYGEFIADYGDHYPVLGWNNQLIYYDILAQSWHEQKCRNRSPQPRAAHTCTKINEKQVVLFGGRTIEGRTNELFILNLDDFSWSSNLNQMGGDQGLNAEAIPCERSWHSMTKIDENHVFLYGGLSKNRGCIGDGWLFDTINLIWKKINTPLESRLWHTASAVTNERQIYIFGGSSTDVFQSPARVIPHMLQISLAPESLKTISIRAICSNMEVIRESALLHPLPIHLKNLIKFKLIQEQRQHKKSMNFSKCPTH